MQKLRQVPDEEQAEGLLGAAGTSSAAYREVFMKVNMSLDAKIREALAAEDKGGGASGSDKVVG